MKLYQYLIVAASLTLAVPPPAFGCKGGKDHGAELLKKYDANGDGKLDDAEKAAAKKDHEADCEAYKAKIGRAHV